MTPEEAEKLVNVPGAVTHEGDAFTVTGFARIGVASRAIVEREGADPHLVPCSQLKRA